MLEIENKIGLEAEVFLIDKKTGDLVIAGDRDLPHDDFALLGEIRGEPGRTVAETLANFTKAFYEFKISVNNQGLVMDLQNDGEKIIDHQLWRNVLKNLGPKNLPECKNIYGTDITKFTSQIVKEKEIVGHVISTGLHIHFSSRIEEKYEYPIDPTWEYSPINIPIMVAEAHTTLNLFKRNLPEYRNTIPPKRVVSVSVSRITQPVLKLFVSKFDAFAKEFIKDLKSVYRKPGFYELKPYGFEYRSLPFSKSVFDKLPEITEFAFDLFNQLTLK